MAKEKLRSTNEIKTFKHPHGDKVIGVPLKEGISKSSILPNVVKQNSLTTPKSRYNSKHFQCPPMDYGQNKIPDQFYYLVVLLSCALTIFFGFIYLCWKSSLILSNMHASGYTALLFLAVEIICFLSGPVILLMEVILPPRKRTVQMMKRSDYHPTVSIFICCCNEPLDVIQDTVRGSMNQIYPTERFSVWILDDGGDDDLKAWAESLIEESSCTVKYVRREKVQNQPHHYKAGNINWSLHLAKSEYVAVFDADMIPSPYYLSCMLPHFDSEDIAFVQCPQSFYNIGKGDPLNDSSENFYNVLLPYRDGRDAAQCVGTGVIIKKLCLRENKGFSIGSVTEDFNTALSFHSRGYKSVYVNQKLQAGLAPWSLNDYVKQHQRWLTGSLQILFSRQPLFLMDGRFSLYLRFSYWYSGVQYFMNIVVLILLILPIFILLFDLRIAPKINEKKDEKNNEYFQRLYIILLVPYILSSRLFNFCLFLRLNQSMRVQIRTEQVWYWMSSYNFFAIFKFFFPFFAKTFEVTGSAKTKEKKENDENKFMFKIYIVWFHILYCLFGLATVFYSLCKLKVQDCGEILRVSSWGIFILFCIQNMAVPVFFLFSNDHPSIEERRKLLKYDDYGYPMVTMEQLIPPNDWMTCLYGIIPLLLSCLFGFLFYAAITDYRFPFCRAGFFEQVNF